MATITWISRMAVFLSVSASSKKLNASLHFFLPDDITLSIFAYDILGVDRKSGKSDTTVS